MTINYPAQRFTAAEAPSFRNEDDVQFMKERWPAIFSRQPDSKMSEKYQFFGTDVLATKLEDHGLKLAYAGQQYSSRRNPLTQEHVLRFTMPEDYDMGVGDSAPELIIFNSHNGRTTLRVYLGVFRFVCANGMVISEGDSTVNAIRHFGEANTAEAAAEIVNAAARRMKVHGERINAMQSAMLSRHMQNQLAKELMQARGLPSWVEAKQVLEAHRPEDERGPDGERSLWVTYNVIQENLTNRSIQIEASGDQRARSTKLITAPRPNLITNEKLWATLDTYIAAREKYLPESLFKSPELEAA